MGEPELADVAPTRGQGRAPDKTKGRGVSRGASPLIGQTRLSSPDPEYEPERPISYVSPSPVPDTTPSF